MKPHGHDLPSLLLLPFPPDPATKESLSAAYRAPLEASISRTRNPTSASILIVAVACPSLLSGRFQYSKTLEWARAQSLLAGIYSVASVVCAKLSVAAHIDAGPGSVDVRVVLVDHLRRQPGNVSSPDDAGAATRAKIEPNNTAVVGLATFAAAYFPWRTIFHCSTEEGLRLHADYLRLAEGKQALRQEQLVAVGGGVTMNAAGYPSSTEAMSSPGDGVDPRQQQQTKLHHIVCIGGTFDHLHAGHKLLLTAGALLLEVPTARSCANNRSRGSDTSTAQAPSPCRLIIGVTGDELLRNKEHAELVQPWAQRARGVVNFLSTILELRPEGWKTLSNPPSQKGEDTDEPNTDGVLHASFRGGAITIECVRIQDAFGPTITMPEVSSLVVSAETRSGGKAVNDKRGELGWSPLEIFEVDVLEAVDYDDGSGTGHGGAAHLIAGETAPSTGTSDFASKISSTAIRKAEAEAKAHA